MSYQDLTKRLVSPEINADDLNRRLAYPQAFEWRDLNYVIHKNKKQVLYEAFGTVKKGEITALIGSSGAGKSTLLNVLAHKTQSSMGKATGVICFDGKPIPSARELKKFSSYLRQEDIFHVNLTPREVLMFSLNMISNESAQVKANKINETLKQLNLEKCADSRIGNFESKGISGGEKRRLSMAMEFINDPSIVFLDEPTSGLDSFSALLVISILKKEAM
jgi:ABC-type multidrug transport system ATPase subunit